MTSPNKAVARGRMRRVRRVGHDLEFKTGLRKCRHMGAPGKPEGARRTRSPYADQLLMKQMIRFYYGVQEGQFKNYYARAERQKGSTGHNLLKILESRLDNTVYRLGFASTRQEARQMVSHGHMMVKGRRVTIPSYQLSIGDTISVTEKAKKHLRVLAALQIAQQRPELSWLDINLDDMSGVFKAYPEMDELPPEFAVNLVVELYSKC
jgi:small subunit ribosomal protein S4